MGFCCCAFLDLEKSDCETEADLVGFCIEWASIGLPHAVEVVRGPDIEAWATYLHIDAIANFFQAIIFCLLDFDCSCSGRVEGNFALCLVEEAYFGTDAYAEAFAVVVLVDVVL